jgi:SAM-dependent methyltransferase
MTTLLAAFDVQWQGRSVLLIAADAHSLAERLRADHGPAAVDALDTPTAIDAGLEQRSYDIALVGDVLHELPPSAVHDAFRWIRDHLRPGGLCLVQTRTYLAPDGAGLGERLHTPYAHLAFARDAIQEYYEANGWGPPPPSNCMCRATYFVMFRRAGLEIEDVEVESREPQLFADKLHSYDQDELRAAGFRALLRRPADAQGELDELRGLLKAG